MNTIQKVCAIVWTLGAFLVGVSCGGLQATAVGVAFETVTVRDMFAVASLCGSRSCHGYSANTQTLVNQAFIDADAMMKTRENRKR